jgi:hypothetical protein
VPVLLVGADGDCNILQFWNCAGRTGFYRPFAYEYWRGSAAVTYNLHAFGYGPSPNPNGQTDGKVKTVFRIIER